jgi:hypothetical protein
MRNDLTPEQLKQPINVTLPLGVVLGLVDESQEVISLQLSEFSGLPSIGAKWEGGIRAGLSLENERPVALVLLPGEFEGTWKDTVAWAEKQGGVLPSRIDQLVLFKNLKSEFKETYYWSGEEYAPDPDYAWGQCFSYGGQFFSHKVSAWRARAVRRVVLK